MFRFKKIKKIFDPSEIEATSWMNEFAQSPSVLVFDSYVRVYFCTRPAPDAQGMFKSYISYIDLDRYNLTQILNVSERPVLNLGDFGTFDEFGTNPVSAISIDSEIRLYYAGWTRCESVPFNAAVGLAISSDGGNTFTRIGPGPILGYTPDEPFLLGSPRIRRFNDSWQLWYVSGKEWKIVGQKPEPVYKIRMAESEDGISWTKQGKDLIPSIIGPDECQACPDVLYRNGAYHMFFSFRSISNYKDKIGGYRLGYAVSNDMINWIRDDSKVQLELSRSGWDSEMISYPHVFELDGSVYMFYQGNEMGRTGFGLAILEEDEG